MMTRILSGAAFVLLLAAAARAAPPENADPTLAPWYQGLRQPGTGIPCCSVADCRPTDYRTSGDHYEALIDGAWLEVPRERVLRPRENPVGRAVVCWTPRLGIMCFVKGPEI